MSLLQDSGATLTAANCAFKNNGDAINGSFAMLNVENLSFSGNSYSIHAVASGMTISNCSFTGDEISVYSGHAGSAAGGTSVISGCSSSSCEGNAIWLDAGDMTVGASTFENNLGSAIYLEGGSSSIAKIATPTINDGTVFSGNSAAAGAAIYVNDGTLNTLAIDGAAFSSNSATDSNGDGGRGGAIYISSDVKSVSISNSTFTGNTQASVEAQLP